MRSSSSQTRPARRRRPRSYELRLQAWPSSPQPLASPPPRSPLITKLTRLATPSDSCSVSSCSSKRASSPRHLSRADFSLALRDALPTALAITCFFLLILSRCSTICLRFDLGSPSLACVSWRRHRLPPKNQLQSPPSSALPALEVGGVDPDRLTTQPRPPRAAPLRAGPPPLRPRGLAWPALNLPASPASPSETVIFD